MARTLFRKVLESTTQAVGKTLNEALQALSDHHWCSTDESFFMRLCLGEALVNAVVHGNKGKPERKIEIHIFEDEGCCRILVRDEGEGFDPATITMANCDELGGRGVCLIKHYMEHVHFNCAENALEMVFHKDTFSS